MSEYADLKIGNQTIWLFRNYLERSIISLFFNDNSFSKRENAKYDETDAEEEPHTEYKYCSQVKLVKERFDALGISIQKVKNEFEKLKYVSIDCFSSFSWKDDPDEYEERSKNIIDRNVTFQKWFNSISKIIDYERGNGRITEYSNSSFTPKTACQKLIFNSMREDNDCYYGMNEKWNYKYTFRILLECFNDEELVECDFSNLFYWDEQPNEKILFGGPAEKTIVMVEGVNDKKILEFSSKRLFPHLYDIFYFMDFEYSNNKKRQGGADAIANNTKAFISANLKQSFIAIFDNDTAGVFKKKQLVEDLNNRVPNNYRIINYPNLSFFEKYPTISPNGKIISDCINQRACSIELYLPDRFLIKNSAFYPIQWESLMSLKTRGGTLSSYQGVITNKEAIEKDFDNYIKDIVNGREVFNKFEWERMEILLRKLFFCFCE